MPIILDHSIVGQSLTSLTIRKDREFAACRICGAIFQSDIARKAANNCYGSIEQYHVEQETRRWRDRHNRNHTQREHLAFRASGLTFTPEAAHRLAPFGLVPVGDADQPEIAQALFEAPRAPYDDVEGSLLRKGL